MSELLVVVVVLCHSRVLGLSSSIILRITNNGSHPVLKHTKDPSHLMRLPRYPVAVVAAAAAAGKMAVARATASGQINFGAITSAACLRSPGGEETLYTTPETWSSVVLPQQQRHQWHGGIACSVCRRGKRAGTVNLARTAQRI